jgi:hypothetical protein
MKKKIHFTISVLFVSILLLQIQSFAQTTRHINKATCPGKVDVWPGDTNNDSAVNNSDLLQIGLFYGATGIPRDSVSNLFVSDSSDNWGINQMNANDIKHIDCNGDSIIDANDTLAISLNFNLIRPEALTVHPNNTFHRTLSSGEIYFVIPQGMYNAGDWVTAGIWVGSSTAPINKLYGIAFTINYDASLVQPGSEIITYPESWLGHDGVNSLKLSYIDHSNSIAYGAMTRFDKVNSRGFGKIADFKFQVNSAYLDAADMTLSFANYTANDSVGEAITFDQSEYILPLNSNVGIQELSSNSAFTLAPNPLSTFSTLQFKEIQDNSILKIIDVVGKTVKETKFSGKEVIIEKGEMLPGVYFIQITDKHKLTSYKKIVVQ